MITAHASQAQPSVRRGSIESSRFFIDLYSMCRWPAAMHEGMIRGPLSTVRCRASCQHLCLKNRAEQMTSVGCL